MEVYNLDSSIELFFLEANNSATREECDDFALSLLPSTSRIRPVAIQGEFSYTILAGEDKIFQFRFPSSSINVELVDLAAAIHGSIIARCVYHGTIGEPNGLGVYEMDKLPGVPYIIGRNTTIPQPPAAVEAQQRTVQGFASFFAQAWNNPQRVDEGSLAVLSSTEFRGRFDQLAESLPPRFTAIVNKVRRDLPALFASGSEIPLALTHGDMCEMNILVDPPSGELTGVIDWTEGRILPFGFALYGLENLLGFMDQEGWHYYDNADQLRSLFWRVFQEEIGNTATKEVLRMIWTVRMAGILYRYGLVHDGTAVHGVVDPENSALRYLDAFCTWDGWAQTE